MEVPGSFRSFVGFLCLLIKLYMCMCASMYSTHISARHQIHYRVCLHGQHNAHVFVFKSVNHTCCVQLFILPMYAHG